MTSLTSYFRIVLGTVLVLMVACGLAPAILAQQVPYGTNAAAGHYVQIADAKIYYEKYGQGGRPLVMLHGGVYGYIDEFSDMIGELSKKRTVIAIATRGYGRSERGTLPFSHRQFAADAAAVLQQILQKDEKVDVLGFSEGAITAYILASSHPELVHRLVAIGGLLGHYANKLESLEDDGVFTPEMMQKQVPDLVARRKKQMLHPELWETEIRELVTMYQKSSYVKQSEIKAIKAPTLIMAGDQDPTRQEHFVEIFRLLPDGELAIVPGCGHVVFHCKPELVLQMVSGFLAAKD